MPPSYSDFAQTVTVEGAFGVLAVAKQLKAAGKKVIELEIGDSPFPSTPAAKQAGIEAIQADQTHYCPSVGVPEFRRAASDFVNAEFGLKTTSENIVAGPGAKIFEPLFCQAFLNPGDGVLVFSPYFPTYLPNIASRQARAWLVDLKQEQHFRPDLAQVERFLKTDPHPKAIFLNSPHNPTGGVAREEDLRGLADLVRGRNVAVFCDEPYCHMVWQGRHHSLLAQPGMIQQCVAAYTFSKSYSMSGWRLGFAVASADHAAMLGKLMNISVSCVPPLVQLAGAAALRNDHAARDEMMGLFREKVAILHRGLNQIPGVKCLDPGGAFYVFPNVAAICNRYGITSHGLAMYLLEGADDAMGVACLGGESFGDAGAGFIRFSCAEPNELLREALEFMAKAFENGPRIAAYLARHPEHQLAKSYASAAD
jgi:aspartate aminotransferase